MKQNLHIALIVSCCLVLIFDFMQKLGSSVYFSVNTNAEAPLFILLLFGNTLLFYSLFTVHLVQKKFWFILIVQFMYASSIISEGFAFAIASSDWRNQDYSVYEFFVKLNFWLGILTATAFIWTDRKNFSWLTWYGVSLAFQTIGSTIYLASGGQKYHWIFLITSFIPALILLGYFISIYQKN